MTQPQPAPRQQRLLALDPGGRRIGVALSDELGLFAHPRAPIVAIDEAAAVDAVARLVESEGVTEIVVGLPLTLAGGESDQTRAARRFAAALRARSNCPVTEVDERLTTREAARTARGRTARQSGRLDSASAAVLLQSVLDSRRSARP